MESQKDILAVKVLLIILLTSICFGLVGCEGYSAQPLFNDEVTSVYVEMFDNKGFERGVEYKVTDALAKRIEAETPYKIVSSRDRADTVISGYIAPAGKGILSMERETGRPMEKQLVLTAVVNWKNLKTGEMLLEEKQASASASYSHWQSQGIEYGSALAANKLAERIVELMEMPW